MSKHAEASGQRPSSKDLIPLYVKLLDELRALPDRDQKLAMLGLIIDNAEQTHVSEFMRQRIIHFAGGENIHIAFVKSVYKHLGKDTNHDWSKDHFYVFVLLGRFGLGIPADAADFQKLFMEEVDRHYLLEPHHSEFEQFNGDTECADADIEEMAIDKLTRNVVAANGGIDTAVMRHYEPQFFLGDKVDKLKRYWEYVEQHRKMVQDVYADEVSTALAERGDW